jgi:hypothetical protein
LDERLEQWNEENASLETGDPGDKKIDARRRNPFPMVAACRKGNALVTLIGR